MLEIHLSQHFECLSEQNSFGEAITGSLFLEHQRQTADAVPTYPLTINTYPAGTGKTLASLLGWLSLGPPRSSSLPNMLFIAPTNELIAQQVKAIQHFAVRANLDVHILHVDAAELRALPTPHEHERVGEKLNRLIENPQEKGYVGRKPIALVTNPDIFYYALYFAAYNPIDRRNLFERFLLRFDYIVIDEFHYYSPKQLACFLFFFAICREWGYFERGRRVCLLSATPEPEVRIYLERLFEANEMAWIVPADSPATLSSPADTPAMAPVNLRIFSSTINDFAASSEGQSMLREWLHAGRDGALISNALWRINVAHSSLIKGGFRDRMARLTGAENSERRRIAPSFPLLLATPTVDIGYNFDKPGKARQPLDFIVFDARTRDAYLQRLARAGRVLGRAQTDIMSDAIALVDDETYQSLKTLDGRSLTRVEFAKAVWATMPPRFDLYAYLRSYAVLEAFRPIFNLDRMTRPDLHEWIEHLFERIRDTFAPNSNRHRYGNLRRKIEFQEQLERIVRRKEDRLLDILPEYVRYHLEHEERVASDQELENLRRRLVGDPKVQRRVREWADEQYHLTEALFNFREAFQTPTAFVFDPQHLLSDSDTALYDALHVAANFRADWFSDSRAFEQARSIRAGEADVYCHVQKWHQTRLSFSFDYHEPELTRERFEQLRIRRPIVLKGLRLRGCLSGQEAPFPLDPNLREILEERWVPLLILRPQDEGRLRSLLHGNSVIIYSLQVSFAQGVVKYPVVIGTAAFIIHAELERYLSWRERTEGKEKSYIV